jgi:imidazolonepropionase-like amidohydrolase
MSSNICIKNVRVFDGQSIREPIDVYFSKGLICTRDDFEKSSTAVQDVDGQGGVLLPGLIDAHVHLHGTESLQQLASYGVTTALDMAIWPPQLLESLRGREGLTDIRSAGFPATSPGSRHSKLPGFNQAQDNLVASPADAEKFVNDRVAEGSDYIKIVADIPGPDQPTLNALATAARAKGKLSVAHAASFATIHMAQEAGVDVITHAPLDKVLDDAAVHRMLKEKRILVPTLTMMEGIVKNIKAPFMDYSNCRETVRSCYRAGVPILAGTDANQAPGVPATVKHGESIHHELELLVEAGLSTVDALRAATVLPAKHFGLNDRGVIEPGYRADLVLLSNDPTKDIRATRSIKRVWCCGVGVDNVFFIDE